MRRLRMLRAWSGNLLQYMLTTKRVTKKPIADSGSVLHACPKGYHPEIPAKGPGRYEIVSATGHTVKSEGKTVVTGSLKTAGHAYAKLSIEYEVGDIHRPVLSVSQSVREGKTIWFSKKGSGIARSEDVEVRVMSDFLPLKEVDGVYELDPVKNAAVGKRGYMGIMDATPTDDGIVQHEDLPEEIMVKDCGCPLVKPCPW